MKKSAICVSAVLLVSSAVALAECPDADGNIVDETQCAGESYAGAGELPEAAAARVYDLNVEARFFTAIGFHKQSRERRNEIARIYDEHGVPLPDEYKE
jgi:hypothetical protein